MLMAGLMIVKMKTHRWVCKMVFKTQMHDGVEKPRNMAKVINSRLHDRNGKLYYKLINNIKDIAPIIYTLTVGLVCQNYSGLFRRPHGMYLSAKDKGEMMSIIYNWPAAKVLPIMLDVGTNNEKLLKDRLYLGLRERRFEGEEYISIVDELMEALHTRCSFRWLLISWCFTMRLWIYLKGPVYITFRHHLDGCNLDETHHLVILTTPSIMS
ncbi:putative malate dehydrogenase (decarboxylating) [Helianthus annuus]|nr:putative malate dehydrogenase (decarboxylating) [Helianthus annuus]